LDLEERILHYYLKIFSICIILLILYLSIYILIFFNKNLVLKTKIFTIAKGEKIENLLRKNVDNLFYLDILYFKIFYQIKNRYKNIFIHYGDFKITKNPTPNELISLISKPSNVLNKITIIEGWSQEQLNYEIAKNFSVKKIIPYEDVIADTYYFNKNQDFDIFTKKLIQLKKEYFSKHDNHPLLKEFNINEIIIIGSLIEKEGLDKIDKQNIASVIFNRLKNKMKLQIDATVIYSLTNGKYNLNRKLLISDLKFIHPYNTYVNTGLPPKPISYVGKKTLDIIFENYKTDFLFYFFNKSLNRHIFSKNYEEHKLKLNEYRNKQ
tara:strand:- start:600 stop:1568 length:969 start_codon:yes stop_codon:yes gene_type:complete